ncbi:unnamed protein product [Sphagnum troendelagicum]|uniref:RING-type domain-containing protein n=1 Tax=Sphagnum troendelagicum TaxID=128251 RepID=A0ABP0U5H2_9BRYO
MENAGLALEMHRTSTPNSRRFGMQLSSANFLPAPLSALLELTGLIRGRSQYSQVEEGGEILTGSLGEATESSSRGGNGGAEVSIRIFGAGEPEQVRVVASPLSRNTGGGGGDAAASTSQGSPVSLLPTRVTESENNPGAAAISAEDRVEVAETTAAGGTSANARQEAATSQRYDFQQLARWIEQALPFTILLLMVFIRQHLQGFLVSVWITAVMFKANDLLRKQTALKNERRPIFLVGLGCGLLANIAGLYWWYSAEALWRPLLLLPPYNIPKFWQAVFTIVVNDTVVRKAAMALKSGLLVYYKNSRGRNYRRQAQLLTLVEYILLLYRALIPTPVWYRFFLNKEYGNLFSALTTGLYLTFKLTSTLEKMQTFLAALRALSRREVQYGAYATSEEVLAAGDMCAICQEKMHAPISLCCKHVFCEDCVSEWFERERTCPLCRAVVKLAGLRSYGDGSTNLFIQLF